jgi:hypothetical protein
MTLAEIERVDEEILVVFLPLKPVSTHDQEVTFSGRAPSLASA